MIGSHGKEVKHLPVSEAQKKATARYEAKRYDKPVIRMDKGKKDKVAAHAEERGESFNGFVNRAIDETMTRDKAVGAFTVGQKEGGA